MGRVVVGCLSILLIASAGFAVETKDANAPVGVPAASPEATGGPDAFGYTYFDQADGCTYDFIDISATGTLVGDGDDVGFPVAMGASFDFYGTAFSTLAMSSNGYMSTDTTDAGPDLSNDCPIPATPSTPGGTTGARLYPLHDDLDLEPGIGRALYEYFPVCPRINDRCAAAAGMTIDEDCSVFMWDEVAHWPGGAPAPVWDMEVVIYHQTNDIVYLVGPGNSDAGAGSTTGMQDFAPPTTALTYSCDAAGSVPDSTAVCNSHPNDVSAFCASAPAIIEVPTADHRGLITLATLLALLGAGMLVVRRRTA